ncbi:MAG: PAS domain S-box protein, partial [candidate division Zixibacteria bacterium]|nr:PAS domain S-box protein [candidate division Zixibacteria bacterium]
YEVKLRKKDGSIVVISTSSSFHRDSRGRIAGVEGVIRDVTERRAADKALVESEERYRSLVESASEAIFSLDRQGEFLFMNSIAAERLGGMPSDFIGKKMWDLFPKEQADSQMASILEVLDTGEGLVKETEVQLLGKLHRYITGIEPVKDTTGRVVAATAFARDISELALTRRQLETEKDFVRSLLDTANSLIVCLDNEARITVFNKGCEEVTGYSRAEVLGLRWPETFLPDESHHDGLDDFVNWVKEHPQDTYEGPLRTKSGEIRTILWSNSAMFNGAADEFVAIAVGQDITDKKQAQEALKESELRYASLVESTDIGIGVVDTQTREFLFVNSGMCRHLGFSQEEILKKSIETMHPPGAVEDAFRAFEGIVSGRINIFAELPFLHKDGSLRYFDVTGVIHDFDGRNAVIGYFRDVTERRQGQQALRESEDFNRAVIERSPVGVTVRNRAGRLLTYNEAWRRIWQVTDQDLHDYTTRERPELVFDKRDNYLGEWKDQVSRVYGEGGYLHIPEIEAEGSSKHKHLWLSQHFYALKDVTGQVDRVVVLTEDITERKQAEEALRESEERFRTLAEATPISMVVTNAANGTILYANLAVAESLGYKQSDLIGMKAVDLYLTPADRAQALDILRETGLVRNFETRVIRADGSYLWGLLSLSPITFHSEPAFFGSLVDITERREAEQRLREAEEARYNQVKQIAGGVAHEIYNALFPATSCLAKLSDRLPDGSTDDMQRNRRLLQLTESAVGRAIEMTDLVTRYSRLDSEQKTEPVALRSLLDEILETNADRINDLDIDVHLAVAEDVIISCRTDHLHSLFSNLLVNALDALEEVTARQIRVVASEEKGVVRIRFIDTGPGIPSEHRPRIFDPFFSTKPTRGTGLGLAIVKRIVELYGGRIDLEPMVDKGSIFVIFLKSARIDPS